jgi:hypothetical protein
LKKNRILKNTGISSGGFLNEPPVEMDFYRWFVKTTACTVEIYFYRRFLSWSPPFYFYWHVITKTASKKTDAGKNIFVLVHVASHLDWIVGCWLTREDIEMSLICSLIYCVRFLSFTMSLYIGPSSSSKKQRFLKVGTCSFK